ncbi:radical SAM protein [Syntrophobacter fumaroxidans]|uniref:Radical SAM domain protein n=1 Tax=Syntrophobacter fumaroxidans (strain DSM 10017 / MPOB) TaxID=335543 RepID=A0LKI2_SYNFM|nr:radical SAM protein [Syntrophobacter fumaroxidans]ABK17934.1 Radical SAM domain protein [Syntrophobacter fumaroxidans MPOB]
MGRTSAISLNAIVKNIRKMARHPQIALRLASLQTEKWFFDLLNPRVDEGFAKKIRQVSFRITDICNLRCTTCGQWGKDGFLHGRDQKELKKQEVSLDRYVEVLSDLVREGHRPFVYLWGGEPMLYEGSVELIERASMMGLPVSIATNGTHVAANARRLAAAPMFLLQMSIDGHCAEVHNRARPALGGMNNFAAIEAAFQAVRRERETQGGSLPLIASLTVISRTNSRHLVDIYETFRDRADLFVFYLSWWIDEERARLHDEDFSRRFGFTPTLHWGWTGDWKPDDCDALERQMKTLEDVSRGLNAPPVIFIPNIRGGDDLRTYFTDHRARFGFDRCISIYQAVEVNSNGDMSPCRDYHDYVVGNIKERSITELWNSARYRQFRRSLTKDGLMPACSRCCGLMGY